MYDQVLNFSIAYGKTAHGLARDWKTDLEEAQQTVNRWYADRPEVRRCRARVRCHLLLVVWLATVVSSLTMCTVIIAGELSLCHVDIAGSSENVRCIWVLVPHHHLVISDKDVSGVDTLHDCDTTLTQILSMTNNAKQEGRAG